MLIYLLGCVLKYLVKVLIFRGELQRDNKLISRERVFKMLANKMYINGIGQAVLKLLRQVFYSMFEQEIQI